MRKESWFLIKVTFWPLVALRAGFQQVLPLSISCAHVGYCEAQSHGPHQRLDAKMDDMTVPQKWSQSISITPWWMAAVYVISCSRWDMDQSQIHFSQRWSSSYHTDEVFLFLISLVFISFMLQQRSEMSWLTAKTESRLDECVYLVTMAPFPEHHWHRLWLQMYKMTWRRVVHLYIQSMVQTIFLPEVPVLPLINITCLLSSAKNHLSNFI